MKNKKILVSAITLVFAVVALVSTTFAWFTMNTTNTIGNLDFQATAGEGLYVSATGNEGSYKGSLTSDEIKAVSSNIGFTDSYKLLVLTSKDGLIFKDYKAVNETKGFIEFKLHFRSQVALNIKFKNTSLTGTDKTIDLPGVTSGGVFDSSKYEAGALSFDATVGAEKAILKTNLANAIRFSTQANGAGAANVFDLNSEKGFKGVEPTFADSMSFAYLEKVSSADANLIKEKFGKSAESTIIDTEFLPSTPITTIDNTTLVTLGNLTDGWYTGSVTIKLWVEGFDNDCFDVLFNQKVAAIFGFEGTVI